MHDNDGSLFGADVSPSYNDVKNANSDVSVAETLIHSTCIGNTNSSDSDTKIFTHEWDGALFTVFG